MLDLLSLRQMLIRARLTTANGLDSGRLLPFVQEYGRLPALQMPSIAEALHEDGRLLVYAFETGDRLVGFAVVKLRHRILADVSFGPIVLSPDLYPACVRALKGVLRRRGALLLRVMPPSGAPDIDGLPAAFNWATSVVDISRNENDLLQSFSPNHRQSIRKAVGAGMQVADLTEAEIALYAAGHVDMFARRGIPRSLPDTLHLVEGVYRHPEDAFILVAHSPDSEEVAGGGIFIRSGDTCTYYQGYAARTTPPTPVLHVVLWEAMKRAKEIGCTRFDLYGYSLDDSDTQLKAVNDFKRWFRGDVIRFPKTVLLPLYPFLPALLRLSGKRF